MYRNHLALLALVLALVGGSVAVAGCGGGGNGSAAQASAVTETSTEATTDAVYDTSTDEAEDTATDDADADMFAGDDCMQLIGVAMDLGQADSTGTGFDYDSDREFMDGFADRAPGGVAESARRVRDLVDRYASAAQDAGLEPDADATEDQIAQISSAMSYSDDEQAENAEALSQLTVYAGTSC